MFVDMQTTFKTTAKEVYDYDGDDRNNEHAKCEINNENKDETNKNGQSELSAIMADNERANTSLCNIPFGVTLELIKSLDTDRGWEDLAAEADFTFDQMQILSRKQHFSDGSPTRTLLWELGCKNYRVIDLYDKLKSIRRLREMQILETYVKGGQEGKGTTIDKKIAESFLLVSLPQHKAADQKPLARAESGFSMSGSEINFNHPSFVDKSKAKVTGSKHYEDKIIPGTDSRSLGSSCASYNKDIVSPLKEANHSTRNEPVYIPQVPLPKSLNSITFKEPNHKSLPFPILSPIHNGQAARNSPGGKEDMPQMFSDQDFSTSSVIRSMTSQNRVSQSTQPSINTNQRLDSTSSSPQPENFEINKACFSYRELYNATDGFIASRIIGEGAFGKVYLGTIHHLDCAIKILQSSSVDTQKKLDQVKSELAALLKYHHENIVTLYGYAQRDTELCLVYQYLIGGSLEDRLLRKNNTPSLSWERRLNILLGVCKGLHFLHTLGDKPLIHGDIKSANILLDQYFEAKLGDLGQAKYATSQSAESTGLTHYTVAESTTKLFGSKAYLAHELRSGGAQAQSLKSDVYALGVVFLEVCSGLQAYDQNRNENTFLADYFNTYTSENDEHLWKEQFQDKTLTDVPDDIFIGVLKLAKRCTHHIKKSRPDTAKLLSEVKDIYKRNTDKPKDEGTSHSITSSLENDSRSTIFSHDLISNNESHHGEHGTSSVQTYESAQQKIIRLEQQQRLEQFHSNKATKPLELQNRHPLQELLQQQAPYCIESCSSAPVENTVEIRNLDNPLRSCPLQSLEAFKLQSAYDRQPGRMKIEQLSGLSQKENRLFEEYPSDPHKLKKIDEFVIEQQKCMPYQCTTIQSGNELQEDVLQVDPKKLAQLNAFDETNFPKTKYTEDDAASLECDPVKLAFLRTFDADLLDKLPRKDGKTAASEINDKFYKPNDSLTPTGQQFLNTQERFPYNSPPSISSDNRPVYGVEYIHESHTKEGNNLVSASNRNDNRRRSDDSNTDNDQASHDTNTEEKPGKKKISSLFSRYRALQDNDDADGDHHSGNEELTGN